MVYKKDNIIFLLSYKMFNKQIFTCNKLLIYLILSIILFSGVISKFLNATSLYPSALILLTLLFLIVILKPNIFYINRVYLFFVIIFVFYNFIVLNISIFLFGDNGIKKSFNTLTVLFILFILAPVINYILKIDKAILINKFIEYILIIFIISGYISYYFQKTDFFSGKYMFFYSEPSHFALVFNPIFLFITKTNKSEIKKLIYIFSALLLAVLVENLTLLLGIFFCFFFTLKIGKSLFLSTL